MNIHKNARLTLARRIEMVEMIVDHGVTRVAAARMAGVCEGTVRKWMGRYLAEGEVGLNDRSSRPTLSPRTIKPETALAIVELRRRRLTHARIAASLGVLPSTVGRVLRRAGLSRWCDLESSEPVVRYEHENPGDLVHIDTKKLGRIERLGHRITGNRRDTAGAAGWEFLFVAIDDHSRISFTDLYPDERKPSAIQFLQNTIAYYRSLGVLVRRILTDNGSAFRSKAFKEACEALNLTHRFTRAYRPQTNGKADDSSNLRFENGLAESRITIHLNASKCSSGGATTTTGTARMEASKAWHPSVA